MTDLCSETVLQDRYELQETLGGSATRQTWLARDRQSDTLVVVKLLVFNLQLQWQEVKLFEREAQTLQTLDHPRIPKYLDYFSVSGPPDWFALVQTYIEGRSLRSLADAGERFDEDRLRHIATEMLSILEYLHALQPPVLHRDIKPSNILADESDRIYLVDFGAAQVQPVLAGTFTVVGTYGYTPMEQFGGRAVPASDLFSLGATLVNLTTGVSPADLTQDSPRMTFSDRTSLSAGFTAWLTQMVEPHASDRYESAQAASNTLSSGSFLKQDFQRIIYQEGKSLIIIAILPLKHEPNEIKKSDKKEQPYSYPQSLLFKILAGVSLGLLASVAILSDAWILLIFILAMVFGDKTSKESHSDTNLNSEIHPDIRKKDIFIIMNREILHVESHSGFLGFSKDKLIEKEVANIEKIQIQESQWERKTNDYSTATLSLTVKNVSQALKPTDLGTYLNHEEAFSIEEKLNDFLEKSRLYSI